MAIIKLSEEEKDELVKKHINEINRISLLHPNERKEKLKECINEAQNILLKNVESLEDTSHIKEIIRLDVL